MELSNIEINTTIPKFICNLTKLNELTLKDLMLFGTLPNCLSNLSVLNTLIVSYNRLNGSINVICDILTLKYINIQRNRFTQGIECLVNLSDLQYIETSNNFHNHSQFVPKFNPINNPNLTTIVMNTCNLIGIIPQSYQHFTSFVGKCFFFVLF